MKYKLFFIFVIISLCLFPVSAHPGRTDANSGHWNRSTGEYHYHDGEYAGRPSSPSEHKNDLPPVVIEDVTSVQQNTSPKEDTVDEEKEESKNHSGFYGALIIYAAIINLINLYRLFSLKGILNVKYPDRELNLTLPQLKLYNMLPEKNDVVYITEKGKYYHKLYCGLLYYSKNMEKLLDYIGYHPVNIHYIKRLYSPCPRCFNDKYTSPSKFIKNINVFPDN